MLIYWYEQDVFRYISVLSVLIIRRFNKQETGKEWVSLIHSLALHC